MDEQQIITLSHLIKWVEDWEITCHKNNVNPSDVPFFIEHDRRQYRPFGGKLGFGSKEGDVYNIDLGAAGIDKLLGCGSIAFKVNVTVDEASAKAVEKIEAAGGSIVGAESSESDEE